jgi:hypothetical protein
LNNSVLQIYVKDCPLQDATITITSANFIFCHSMNVNFIWSKKSKGSYNQAFIRT